MLAKSDYEPDAARPTRANASLYNYDTRGNLLSVAIDDGRDRTVTFANDLNGQALRRDEVDALTGGDPHEMWFRYGGREMGYAGNNGRTDVHMAASTAQRTAPTQSTTGAFRGGATTHSSEYDFDTSLAKLNSLDQGSRYGVYTVRGGETLQSIAANLWGDAGLWFKLAEANGLTGSSSLSSGQSLTIPAGVVKNTHNADTFRPFDAAEAIGDTSPTAPKPGSKNKCGVFGAVLLGIVAIAVTAIVAPWATGLIVGQATGAAAVAGGIAGAAIGGAAASVVSQGVGLATGLQDKFSFKQVAQAGLSAGMGAAFGGGIVGNLLTQGVAVATGLQKKFDWAGVAAAGVIAGVSRGLGGSLPSLADDNTIGNHLRHVGVSTASLIAGAAGRSVLTGTSFGDNVMAVLPDVIGSTIGNAIGYGVSTNRPRLAYDPSVFEGRDGLSGGGMTAASGTALAAPGVTNAVAAGPVAGVNGGKVGGGPESGDEIIVTGSRRRGWTSAEWAASGAAQEARWAAEEAANGTGPYLNPTMKTFISLPDLRSARGVVVAANADLFNRTGQFYTDYNGIIANYSAREAELTALRPVVDRMTWDVVSPVLGTDVLTAGYRLAVNGEVNWANGITLGAAAFGPLAGIAGKAARAAERTALRSEAAANIWQARRVLAETRPELAVAERNSIIKAFDLQSFRVETLSARTSEFRYFDGLDAGLPGRWSTPQWISNPADRIRLLALPNNQATRAATAILEPGSVVFRGGVAAQLRYGSNLTGGGLQTYNAAGPRAIFKEVP